MFLWNLGLDSFVTVSPLTSLVRSSDVNESLSTPAHTDLTTLSPKGAPSIFL